jgi:hypothetical protein
MAVDFAYEISVLHSAVLFNISQNLKTWGRRLYFPSEGNPAAGFIALKNPSYWALFESTIVLSNDKRDNH